MIPWETLLLSVVSALAGVCGALVGGAATLLAAVLAVQYQYSRERVERRQERKQARLEELRDFLLLASRGARHLTSPVLEGLKDLKGLKGLSDSEKYLAEQQLEQFEAVNRELYKSRVQQAPWLFAHEPEAFEKLVEILTLIGQLNDAAKTGTESGDLGEARALGLQLVVSMREADAIIERLLDEM